MKNDIVRISHETQSMRDRIKDNKEKIKVNKTLPYLVSNVIEVRLLFLLLRRDEHALVGLLVAIRPRSARRRGRRRQYRSGFATARKVCRHQDVYPTSNRIGLPWTISRTPFVLDLFLARHWPCRARRLETC